MGLGHFLLCAALVSYAASQTVTQSVEQTCNSQVRCRDCILANPDCRWCARVEYNGTHRCYPKEDTESINFCGGENSPDVQNPTGNVTGANEEELDVDGLDQISPMRINATIKPGEPLDVGPLTVQPSNNFPIDLYLLMDLSYSMRDDLENLKRLGADIAESIAIISTNFAIGFGSFVDKRLAPYVNTDPARLEDPCNDDCVSPYSFRHVVSLTEDRMLFNRSIQDQVISGNQDSPEGGLDGFLQVLYCRNLIGWRDVSRKLVLFITDAGFHFAGDGKLGGVIKPYSRECMIPDMPIPVGKTIDYLDWATLDYPSIGQLSEALSDLDVIPIFAAESSARSIYERLAEELGDRAFTGELAADSSNIVTLVTDIYNEVSQRIIFEPVNVPGVTVDITPNPCPGEVVNGICTGVEIGVPATFDIVVTLQECTVDLAAGPLEVPVSVVGFGTFTILIDAICTCPCEEMEVEDSDECNGNGTLSCGICECNAGSFGENCQCDNSGSVGGQTVMCPVNELNGLQCTGRGTCTCGICFCDTDRTTGEPLYTGTVCECDQNICRERITDPFCSGRQGMCTCDGCMCNLESNTGERYYGDFCECTPDTDCRDPNNATDNCNGRGTCGCNGMCTCTEDSPYFGQYCEFCSGNEEVCQDLTCDPNEPCAQCVLDLITMFNSAISPSSFFSEIASGVPIGSVLMFDDEQNVAQVVLPESYCNSSCPSRVVIINGTENVEYDIDGVESTRCETMEDGCVYRYYVAVDLATGIQPIHVEYDGACPASSSSVEPWIIALAIIGPLLLLGALLLLLLKFLLLLLDKVEYRRFEEELARTRYNKQENPLYQSANKEYQNPIYGK